MSYCEIVMYQTGDGKVFESPEKANEHHETVICTMFENIFKASGANCYSFSDQTKLIEQLYKERYNIRNLIESMEQPSND